MILSYGSGSGASAATAAVIGKVITLDRQPRIVIGVMPRGFNFPPPMHFGIGEVPAGKELWVPAVLERSNREYHPLGRSRRV